MKSLSILLVDDDEIQRLKFKKACKEISIKNTIIEAFDGENALEILKSKNGFFDLIISDLNIPNIDGIKLLSKVKKSRKFKRIPFVIMTTSNKIKNLKKSYNLGVSGYFVKSNNFKDYSEKVSALIDYWSKSELLK